MRTALGEEPIAFDHVSPLSVREQRMRKRCSSAVVAGIRRCVHGVVCRALHGARSRRVELGIISRISESSDAMLEGSYIGRGDLEGGVSAAGDAGSGCGGVPWGGSGWRERGAG